MGYEGGLRGSVEDTQTRKGADAVLEKKCVDGSCKRIIFVREAEEDKNLKHRSELKLDCADVVSLRSDCLLCVVSLMDLR